LKKTFLLFVAAVLIINLARAQNDWINYKIDNKLSVKVPSQPIKVDDNNFVVKSKDSVAYIIAVLDLQKTEGVDAASLAGLAPTVDFANNIKSGMAGKMQGYTLSDIKTDKWNGYYCYSINGSNPVKKLKAYTFMVLIGATVYTLTAILPDYKSPKVKDAFFASLSLN
jgi:hypothetical protein